MAIHAPITGARDRATTFQPQRGTRRYRRLLATLSPDEVGAAIDALIARLDAAQGDVEREGNGDELDGTAAEDDFYPHRDWQRGAGCPLSDPASFGEVYSDQDILPTLPIYGVDQSRGPINEREATIAYRRAQQEKRA